MNNAPTLIAVFALALGVVSSQAQEPVQVTPAGMAPCDQSWRAAWEMSLVVNHNDGSIRELLVKIRNVGNRKLEGTNIILDLIIDGSFEGWLYDEKVRNTKISLMPNEEVVLVYDVSTLIFKPVADEAKEKKYSYRLIKGKSWLLKASLSDTLTEIPSCESSFLVWSNGVRG